MPEVIGAVAELGGIVLTNANQVAGWKRASGTVDPVISVIPTTGHVRIQPVFGTNSGGGTQQIELYGGIRIVPHTANAPANMIVLEGSPSTVLQIKFGTGALGNAVGTEYSGADQFMSYNAYELNYNSNQWTAPYAPAYSYKVAIGGNSDGFSFHSALPGTATGAYAAFWGDPKFKILPPGDVYFAPGRIHSVWSTALGAQPLFYNNGVTSLFFAGTSDARIRTNNSALDIAIFSAAGIVFDRQLSFGGGASPYPIVMGGNLGGTGSLGFQVAPGTPVASRLQWGTDASGWEFRIAYRVAGVITDQMRFKDNGQVIIGTDPGNSGLLRVGGDLRIAPLASFYGGFIRTGSSGAAGYLAMTNDNSTQTWRLGISGAVGGTELLFYDETAGVARGYMSIDGAFTWSGAFHLHNPGNGQRLLQLSNTYSTAYVGLDGSSNGLGGAGSLNIWQAANQALCFATNNIQRGYFAPSGPLFLSGADTYDSVPATIVIERSSRRLMIGYDTGGDVGMIAAVHTGVAWKPVRISPFGGGVIIGADPGGPEYLRVGGMIRAGLYTTDQGSANITTGPAVTLFTIPGAGAWMVSVWSPLHTTHIANAMYINNGGGTSAPVWGGGSSGSFGLTLSGNNVMVYHTWGSTIPVYYSIIRVG